MHGLGEAVVYIYSSSGQEMGKQNYYSLEGTIFTSEFCPAGQYSPVNSVRGDIIHWGTLFTATTVLGKRSHFAHIMIFLCKCLQCYHT